MGAAVEGEGVASGFGVEVQVGQRSTKRYLMSIHVEASVSPEFLASARQMEPVTSTITPSTDWEGVNEGWRAMENVT